MFGIHPLRPTRDALALVVTLASLALGGSPARAEDYNVLRPTFTTGVPSYAEVLQKLKPGDTLVFPSQARFKVGRKLGEGGTTLILELPDLPGLALRIPKSWDPDDPGEPLSATSFLNRTIDGASELRSHGVPMVEIDSYKRNEYVVVRKVGPHLTFEEFVEGKGEAGVRREALSLALEDFARRTARFERIGDFKSDQVVFEPETGRWVLLDWASSHMRTVISGHLDPLPAKTIFRSGMTPFFSRHLLQGRRPGGETVFAAPDPELDWLADLANRIESTVHEERRRLAASPCEHGYGAMAR